ncbi:MAG: hypothetical protein ACRD2P_10785 [Terriglobia bacterium]
MEPESTYRLIGVGEGDRGPRAGVGVQVYQEEVRDLRFSDFGE